MSFPSDLADWLSGSNPPEDPTDIFVKALLFTVIPLIVVVVFMFTKFGVEGIFAIPLIGMSFLGGGVFVRWVDHCNPPEE